MNIEEKRRLDRNIVLTRSLKDLLAICVGILAGAIGFLLVLLVLHAPLVIEIFTFFFCAIVMYGLMAYLRFPSILRQYRKEEEEKIRTSNEQELARLKDRVNRLGEVKPTSHQKMISHVVANVKKMVHELESGTNTALLLETAKLVNLSELYIQKGYKEKKSQVLCTKLNDRLNAHAQLLSQSNGEGILTKELLMVNPSPNGDSDIDTLYFELGVDRLEEIK